MDEIIEKLEEKIIDLLSRIDEEDEGALEELKRLKKAVDNLGEFTSFIDESDTIESIGKKMKLIEKKFDEFMLELNRVVG